MIKFLGLQFDNAMSVIEGVRDLLLDFGSAAIRFGKNTWRWLNDDQAWSDNTAGSYRSDGDQTWAHYGNDHWQGLGDDEAWPATTSYANAGFGDPNRPLSPAANIDGSPMLCSVDIHGNPYGVTSWPDVSDDWPSHTWLDH